MLRVNAINKQELLKCLTFNPKSLVFKTVSLTLRLYGDGVVDMPLWIDHRIEARQVAGGIGIAESGNNLPTLDAAAQLFRNGLPLTGRRFQSDVAIGGNAMPVHNHTDTALVSLGIEIVECHHVCTTSMKIAVAV